MDRREFLLALPATALPFAMTTFARAECGGQSAASFVETLYQKQARLQAAETPPGEAEYQALFSRRMRRLMRAPRHFPKNMLIGRVLNAFFGWGVLPFAEIGIGKVALIDGDDSGPATVRVEIEHRGELHKVLVRVVIENDDWRIADISYDNGKSLAAHYRSMTQR